MFKSARFLHTFSVAALLACGASVPGVAAAVNAEPLDAEPELLAKMALEKARATSRRGAQAAASRAQQGNAPETECGAVAIGNVVGNNNIGFGPTDVNVVIVGDVINANNNCR